MVVSFAICLYWDQFLTLVGKGRKPARFELRRRREPLAPNLTSKIMAAITGGVMLPYAEELWRYYRAEREVIEADID